MSRSSARRSSASGLRATAASRACENSRPITAPICATSLAGPSRSSRAISDACKLAGTASAGDGTAAAACSAVPSLSASSTALVISSTNRGMPSVRSMMSFRMLAGNDLLPVTPSIMAAMSRSPRRLMATNVTYGRPIQGGSNSGRNVTSRSTRWLATRSTARPNDSKLVGSDQWTSSTIISTGLERDRTSICRLSASRVLCRRRCGSGSSGG